MRARAGLIAVMLLATPLEAQNSVYSVLGIGYPGRLLSVRGRSLGGGLGLFDRASGLNPAAAGAYSNLGAGFSVLTSRRSYDALGTEVAGLRDTRFPNASVGARLRNTPLSFSVGYSLYLERSFDILTSSTMVLRGDTVGIEDRFTSEGGIADMRLSLSYNLASTLWVGVSGHIVSGSTRQTTSRSFDDSLFVAFRQQNDVEYFGEGVAVGFILTPSDFLQLGGAVRFDTQLRLRNASDVMGEIELPTHFSAGVVIRPQVAIRWSTSFVFRTWSDASGDLAALGLGTSADTWDLGTGIEIGGAGRGTSRVPLRFGFRYGLLPFLVNADQPHEINISAGTGFQFAGNRASLDLAVERAIRDGAGASERAWLFNLGLTVRP